MQYLALESGLPSFTRISTDSVLLWNTGITEGKCFYLRDYHPVSCDFPDTSIIKHGTILRSYNPASEDTVWANPLSLAATYGVSVDFLSSGYLDVSVPRVALPHLWIQ